MYTKAYNSFISILDLLILSYLLDTLIFAFFIPDPELKSHAFIFRAFAIGTIVFILFHAYKQPGKGIQWIRYFYPWVFLLFAFYDTAYFHRILFSQTFDQHWMEVDYTLLGNSLQQIHDFMAEFPLLKALLHLSYYLYIPLLVWFLFRLRKSSSPEKADTLFMLCNSLLWTYIIFMILPTHGPQFVVENQITQAYFSDFYMDCLQYPSGGFPSAPILMVWILVLWSRKNDRKFFSYALVLAILLSLAAILLWKSYFISVMVSIVLSPLFYYGSLKIKKLYEKFMMELF